MSDGYNWHDVEFGQLELEYAGSRQRDVVAASETSLAFEAIIDAEPEWKSRATASGKAAIASWERWHQLEDNREYLETIEPFWGSKKLRENLIKTASKAGWLAMKISAPFAGHWIQHDGRAESEV